MSKIPNCVEICLRKSVLFFNSRGIAQPRESKISKMAAILERYASFNFFFRR